MKGEEQQLFEALRDRELRGEDHFARSTLDVAEEIGMPIERADALCQKWADRGWYDYGMRPLYGRLTDAGLAL